MQNKKFILFDFDGTVYDSGPGVMKSVRYSLESFGIEVKNLQDLRCFIGPPLWDSFMEFYGFSKENAELAVKKYREYYTALGLLDGAVYPGIPELLRDLKSAGKTVILATSKPENYLPELLGHLEIERYFDYVAGSTYDASRSSKEDVLAYALQISGIGETSQAVMIGDRKFDVIGARTFGMASIGVLYGYGDRSELAAEGATYIVEDIPELRRLLLNSI